MKIYELAEESAVRVMTTVMTLSRAGQFKCHRNRMA